MEDQALQGTSERNTAPGLTAVDKKGTSISILTDTDEIELEETAVTMNQEPQKSGFFASVGRWFRAYGSSLVMGLPVLPVIVSAIAIGIYLSDPSVSGGISVLYSAIATFIVWMVISALILPLTAPGSVNAHSYGLLMDRLNQLITRLNIIQSTTVKSGLKQYQQIALAEAFDKFDELNNEMNASQARLTWVMGIGYMNAWDKMHRAEEALIEVEPVEMVVRGAYHDYLAISNSKMSNATDLLNKLRLAAKALDSTIGSVFADSSTSTEEIEELKDLRQSVQKLEHSIQEISNSVKKIEQDVESIANNARSVQATHSTGSPESAHKQPADDPYKEANARVALRAIRRALNEFRDNQWLGMINARNRLMTAIFITGLATFTLLYISIFSNPGVSSDSSSGRATILATVAFYIIGAIAGLFGAIYHGSITNTGDDDYGLSVVRLVSTPLVSGLAGIGGVFLYSTLVSQVSSSKFVTLSSTFSLNRLDFLIAAAIFGYAPNLLINGLQTNKYAAALQSSRTSTSTDTSVKQDAGN